MPEADDPDEPRPGEFETVHVDQINRFALEVDERTGRTFLSIPVSNPYVDYLEWSC